MIYIQKKINDFCTKVYDKLFFLDTHCNEIKWYTHTRKFANTDGNNSAGKLQWTLPMKYYNKLSFLDTHCTGIKWHTHTLEN